MCTLKQMQSAVYDKNDSNYEPHACCCRVPSVECIHCDGLFPESQCTLCRVYRRYTGRPYSYHYAPGCCCYSKVTMATVICVMFETVAV